MARLEALERLGTGLWFCWVWLVWATFWKESWLLSTSSGFNINTAFPVKYSGQNGSHFGYSVAQYKINDSSWIIVGAPHERNADTSTQDGAVYKCYATAGLCQPIFQNESIFLEQNKANTNKTEAMLGASVVASPLNGLVVGCAPRYKLRLYDYEFPLQKDVVAMMGACFVYDGKMDKYLPPFTPCLKGSTGITEKQFECGAGMSLASMHFEDSFVLGAVGTQIELPGQAKNEYNAGQFIRMEKTGPLTPDYGLIGEQPDDYLGYAVEAGYFTANDLLDVIASVPRAEGHLGKLRIFGRRKGFKGGWDNIEEPDLIGDQVGEYFGAVLAVGDLNKDGLDDVVVGSPLYADTVANLAEVGRVYIYYQKERHERTRIFEEKRQILQGRESRGRFGAAVTVCVDLDRDGYSDLAVGAPFEDDGSGRVYIYSGSSSGILPDPVQVIQKENLLSLFPKPLFGLGSAVSAQVDVDSNGYTDLAIGAYKSDNVFLLKTHPVVTMDLALRAQVYVIVLDSLSCHLPNLPEGTKGCLRVTGTLEYSGHNLNNHMNFTLSWSLLTGNGSATENLVFFLDSSRSGRHTSLQSRITLRRDIPTDQPMYIYITENIVHQINPIKVRLAYDLIDKNPTNVELPVLNPKVPRQTETQIDIYHHPGDMRLNVTAVMDVVTIEQNGMLEFQVTAENLGIEKCYIVDLNILLPPEIAYASVDSPNEVSCSFAKDTARLVTCNLGFSFGGYTKKSFLFRTTIDQALALNNQSVITFDFNLTSVNDNTTDNNDAQIDIDLQPEVTLDVMGTPVPDQVPVENVEQTVLHTYQVTNQGPTPLAVVNVFIKWPVRTESGVLLLSLNRSILTKNIDKGSCHNEDFTLAAVSSMTSLEPCSEEEPSFLCTNVHCHYRSMRAGETFHINVSAVAHPNISQLLGDNDNTMMLSSRVTVFGYLTTQTYLGEVYNSSNMVTTVITFPGRKRTGEVGWWVYLVSGLLGVGLLIAIIVGFWKLGFFKRQIQEQLYTAKRQSQNLNWAEDDDEQPDENEKKPTTASARFADAGEPPPDWEDPGESKKPRDAMESPVSGDPNDFLNAFIKENSKENVDMI